MALVSGPVAGGRTELLKTFAEKAAAQGALVLEACGTARESELPFGVLHQLFSTLPVPAGRRRARELLGDGACRLPGSSAAGPSEYLRNEANEELWASLAELAGRAPVVLVIDDLHFVDLASLQSLLYFGSRLRSARVSIVAAQLDCPLSAGQPRAVLVTELLRHPRFTALRADPLSRNGIRAILAGRHGAEADGRAVQSWHRLTGGSPFLLKALLEDQAVAAERVEDPLPGKEFATATLACLHRGGRRFLRIARSLAILAESESADLLPWTIEEDEDTTSRLVGAMEDAGLLDSGGFRHPVVRDAVLAELPPEDRAGLHRRAARLLHDRAADPPRIGVHLVAARHSAEPWALDVLLATAEDALRRDDLELTGRCLRLAEAACEDDEQRMAVVLLKVRAEFRLNPAIAWRHLETRLTALREDKVRLDQMVALLRPLLWRGRQDEAALILDRLTRAAGELDERSATELYVIREWLGSAHPRLITAAPDAGVPGGVRSMAVADPLTQAAAVLGGVLRSGPDESTVPTAEWLLKTTVLDEGTLCAIQSAVLALIYADRADLAEQWCDHWLRETAERQAPAWQALLTSARAEIAIRQGEMRSARRYGRAALSLMPRSAWGVAIGSVMANLLISNTAVGAPETADLTLTEVPDGFFETRSGVYYLYARGRRQVAAGRLHAGLDDLLACGRSMQDCGIDLPTFVPWRSDAVEALLRLGHRRQARNLAAEQLARPAVLQPRTQGISLRTLAATEDDPAERERTLLRAVDALENCADRVQLAYTLVDLSDAQESLGATRRAGLSAQRAARLAEERQLEPVLHRLARTGMTGAAAMVPQAREPETVAWDGDVLSAAERRVVMLAVSGRTNREIARELYITVSTVEQHLTRAYRKLNVSGRSDLAARFAGAGSGLVRAMNRGA